VDALAASFFASRGSEAAASELEVAEVRAALDEVAGNARRAWPALHIDDAELGPALAARLEAEIDVAVALRRLHASDVYFVLACAAHQRAALDVFETDHLRELEGALTRQGFAPSAIRESLQIVRTSLLVASAEDGAAPRLLDFAGRGPLRGWLRVVATRIAYRLARPVKHGLLLDHPVEEAAAGDPEIEFLKKRYGEAFRAAFRAAFAELPLSDRLLLKQRFSLGSTVAELGLLHGVHGSTVSRWVTTARQRLVEITRESLVRQFHLGSGEVSSLLRLIHSEIDGALSLSDEVR
jgi:RNA polymerase sigma-70 factor (ECF subfamily)